MRKKGVWFNGFLKIPFYLSLGETLSGVLICSLLWLNGSTNELPTAFSSFSWIFIRLHNRKSSHLSYNLRAVKKPWVSDLPKLCKETVIFSAIKYSPFRKTWEKTPAEEKFDSLSNDLCAYTKMRWSHIFIFSLSDNVGWSINAKGNF